MEFEIADLDGDTFDVYLACGCHPGDARVTDEVKIAHQAKRAWAERMLEKGLGAKMAYDHGYPAGFVEFLPIEVAPAPVKGASLLFITDIHVNDDDQEGRINYEGRGCGRSLVVAAEEYARDLGYKGLATLALDGPWMPAAFYEKLGFSVADGVGRMRLMWKPFEECASPSIWRGNFSPTIGKDVVHVDLIHTSQCWGMFMQAQNWRRVIAEFRGQVVVRTHLADQRDIMSLACMTGSLGVYLDGELGPAHPLEEGEIRALLEEALSRKSR
jgi:GNAT superfamily N-acetyltransferase